MNRVAAALIVLLVSRVNSQAEERLLNYAMAGSARCRDSGPCFDVISDLNVQRTLLALSREELPADRMRSMLGPAADRLDDLQRLRLIKVVHGRYRLAFCLLPAEDVRRMRAVAEEGARRLADKLLARRSEIEEALRSYSTPGLDPRDAAFVVLGCFSLDWDGLRMTKAKGYRADGGAARPDGRYVPWAEERIDDARVSYERSSSVIRGKVGAVSFGDGSGHARWLLEMDAAKWREMLAGGGSQGVPVLTHRDAPMVRRLRAIGGAAMEEWLAGNYATMERELSGLAPSRVGVPFAETFNLVWHRVFGRANAMLVEAGLMGDPRRAGRSWQGYTPAVFEVELTR